MKAIASIGMALAIFTTFAAPAKAVALFTLIIAARSSAPNKKKNGHVSEITHHGVLYRAML